jgi:hypothetical protein
MTPDAPEGTAFQEHAGAYTITIVYTKFLYVEYDSLFHIAHQLS